MFGNRKDPMIDTVQKVMNENARRRQIEADLNEELGIQDRKQLGHEKHDLYDQALLQRINEAKDVEANEEPPFKPDPPRKKRPDEPTTARGLARAAMRDMIAKAAKDTQKTFPNVKHLTPAGNPDWHKHGYKDMPIKEEEQIDELSKKTLGSYIKKSHVSGLGAAVDQETAYKDLERTGGLFDRKSDPTNVKKFKDAGHTGQKREDGIKRAVRSLTKEEEQINELSKETLGSYIKKASHDAATKSAATGRYAERANKVKDETKKGDYSNYQQGNKDAATADKMFGKSWKRREGIAKAVDKLTNEEQIDELSTNRLKKHIADVDAHSDKTDKENSGKWLQQAIDDQKRGFGKFVPHKVDQKALKHQIYGKEVAQEKLKKRGVIEEDQIDEVLDSKMSKLGYMVKSIGSIVKNRGNLDVDHTDKDARRTLTKRKEGYNLVQKKLGPNPIASRMPTMNALEENTSLESIQEEIRNNLLERANHLLENGSQDQIVEFMNDLTMEQRSILNLEEQVASAPRNWTPATPPVATTQQAAAPPAAAPKTAGQIIAAQQRAAGLLPVGATPPYDRDPAAPPAAAQPASPPRQAASTSPLKLPTDPGSFKLNIPTPQAVQPGPPPPAPRTGPPARARAMGSIVPPGLNSNNDDMSLGNGIVKSIGDTWSSMHNANKARVDKENDKLSKGSVTRQNRDAELGAAAITGAPAPAAPVAPAPPATPVAAAKSVAASTPVAAAKLPVAPAAAATAPRPPDNKEYDSQKQSALASAGKTADAFGPVAQTATPAAQQRTATPAPPPASVRAAPAQAAKDDIWDNSKLAKTGENGEETAHDFNRNQATYAARAASPRGQAERNMDESKTKYIPESITFERFLRNR